MKNTVATFKEMKEKGDKITMLTAYDYSTAKLMDEAGINAILVGDSLGMVMMGYEDTISVTMEDMIHHIVVHSPFWLDSFGTGFAPVCRTRPLSS